MMISRSLINIEPSILRKLKDRTKRARLYDPSKLAPTTDFRKFWGYGFNRPHQGRPGSTATAAEARDHTFSNSPQYRYFRCRICATSPVFARVLGGCPSIFANFEWCGFTRPLFRLGSREESNPRFLQKFDGRVSRARFGWRPGQDTARGTESRVFNYQ